MSIIIPFSNTKSVHINSFIRFYFFRSSFPIVIFIIIILIIYFIGFWAGKNWERTTWEDKKSEAPKKKVRR